MQTVTSQFPSSLQWAFAGFFPWETSSSATFPRAEVLMGLEVLFERRKLGFTRLVFLKNENKKVPKCCPSDRERSMEQKTISYQPVFFTIVQRKVVELPTGQWPKDIQYYYGH